MLDNFEHLEGGVSLVSDLLDAASKLTMLATSRARLNLGAECVFELAGMQVPESEGQETFENVEAVALFLAQAQRASPGFDLTAEDKPALTRLCGLVEGMPLALELAAAWTRVLSPAEIVGEIEAGLDFLASQRSDLPQRQRSLRAAFNHSWNLLDGAEQDALIRFSVFRGGATRQAASAVTGASLHTLTALVDRSLWSRKPETGRLTIHELVRQFAAERLAESGEGQAARDAHCAYFGAWLREREAALKGGEQVEALNEITSDLNNVRAAWEWALQQGRDADLDAALDSLLHYYDIRDQVEGEAAFRQAVEVRQARGGDAPAGLMGKLFIRAAWFTQRMGRFNVATDLAREGLAQARTAGERREEALALNLLGYIQIHLEDRPAAIENLEAAASVFEAVDDQWGMALAWHNLGWAYVIQHPPNVAQSLACLQRSLDLRREMSDLKGLSMTLNSLGNIYNGMLLDPPEARRLFEESLATFRQIGAAALPPLRNLALLAADMGDYSEALRHSDEALHIPHDLGQTSEIPPALLVRGYICLRQQQFDEAGTYLHRAVQLAGEQGQLQWTGWGNLWLGVLAFLRGQADEAGTYLKAPEAAAVSFPAALALRGVIACQQRQFEQSRQHLNAALRAAWDAPDKRDGLGVLWGFGEWLAAQRQLARAVELLTIVVRHRGSYGWVRDLAADTLAALEPQLPPDEFAAAVERGQALDLDATLQGLLAGEFA